MKKLKTKVNIILFKLKKVWFKICDIFIVIKNFMIIISHKINIIWLSIKKIFKTIKNCINFIIYKVNAIWFIIKKILRKLLEIIKNFIITINHKINAIWLNIKKIMNRIYLFWIRTKEVRDIIDSIGRKLAQIMRKIINKIYLILMTLLVFSFYYFITLPVAFCLGALVSSIGFIFCVASIYICEHGFINLPEYFIEAPTVLDIILSDYMLSDYKLVQEEFTSESFLKTRLDDLYSGYRQIHKSTIQLFASSLWCTINIFYAPTLASTILDETIKIKKDEIVEETINEEENKIIGETINEEKNKIIKEKENTKEISKWDQIFTFMLCFLLGTLIILCLCLMLVLVFVCCLWGIIYISEQNIMVWSEYFSIMYNIKLPISIIEYLKVPDTINFQTLFNFVWSFYKENQMKLIWIISSLICTRNLWWMPDSAKKIEKEILKKEGSKKLEERKDEEIFDDDVPTLEEMSKELRSKKSKGSKRTFLD